MELIKKIEKSYNEALKKLENYYTKQKYENHEKERLMKILEINE